MEGFLKFSRLMFSGLFSREKAESLYKLTKAEHAFLAHREGKRVNEALASMAKAAGEAEVISIFSALHEDTVMALCSRWMHYHGEWENPAAPVPPAWRHLADKDLWRAVFLSLQTDSALRTSLLKQLCPEALEADRE